MRKRLKQEADQPRQFGDVVFWNWKETFPKLEMTARWQLETLTACD